jgi:hypothetical protein
MKIVVFRVDVTMSLFRTYANSLLQYQHLASSVQELLVYRIQPKFSGVSNSSPILSRRSALLRAFCLCFISTLSFAYSRPKWFQLLQSPIPSQVHHHCDLAPHKYQCNMVANIREPSLQTVPSPAVNGLSLRVFRNAIYHGINNLNTWTAERSNEVHANSFTKALILIIMCQTRTSRSIYQSVFCRARLAQRRSCSEYLIAQSDVNGCMAYD